MACEVSSSSECGGPTDSCDAHLACARRGKRAWINQTQAQAQGLDYTRTPEEVSATLAATDVSRDGVEAAFARMGLQLSVPQDAV